MPQFNLFGTCVHYSSARLNKNSEYFAAAAKFANNGVPVRFPYIPLPGSPGVYADADAYTHACDDGINGRNGRNDISAVSDISDISVSSDISDNCSNGISDIDDNYSNDNYRNAVASTAVSLVRVLGQNYTFSDLAEDEYNIHYMYVMLDFLVCPQQMRRYIAYLKCAATIEEWPTERVMQLHAVDTLTGFEHSLVSAMFMWRQVDEPADIATRQTMLAALATNDTIIYPLIYWADNVRRYSNRYAMCLIDPHEISPSVFCDRTAPVVPGETCVQVVPGETCVHTPTICPHAEFIGRFAEHGEGLLAAFDWTNCIAAGEAVFECLQPVSVRRHAKTIDVYVYGDTPAIRVAAFTRAITHFAPRSAYYAIVGDSVVVCVEGSAKNIHVYYTDCTTPAGVLAGMPVPYLACSFDGQSAGMLPTGIVSLMYRCVYNAAATLTKRQIWLAARHGFSFAHAITVVPMPSRHAGYYLPADQAHSTHSVKYTCRIIKMVLGATHVGTDVCDIVARMHVRLAQ